MISLMLFAQQSNHLFGMDDANKTLLMIENRERAQVVFVEEFSHFFAIGIDVTTDQVAVRKIDKRCLRRGEQELHERDKGDDPLLFIEQVNVGDGLDVAFELTQGLDTLTD